MQHRWDLTSSAITLITIYTRQACFDSPGTWNIILYRARVYWSLLALQQQASHRRRRHMTSATTAFEQICAQLHLKGRRKYSWALVYYDLAIRLTKGLGQTTDSAGQIRSTWPASVPGFASGLPATNACMAITPGTRIAVMDSSRRFAHCGRTEVMQANGGQPTNLYRPGASKAIYLTGQNKQPRTCRGLSKAEASNASAHHIPGTGRLTYQGPVSMKENFLWRAVYYSSGKK